MMAAFYLVYLKAKPDESKEIIRQKMDLALDWYKVDEKVWVLYSTSDPEKLYARLSPLAQEGGHLFICELNKNKRQGWMPRSFWEWLKKKR